MSTSVVTMGPAAFVCAFVSAPVFPAAADNVLAVPPAFGVLPRPIETQRSISEMRGTR